MRVISAETYGILPGCEIGEKLNLLLQSLQNDDEEKEIQFAHGVYYIDADSCPEEKLYITNTISNSEYRKNEPRHICKVAFDIKNTRNLTLNGEGSEFILRGKMTNAVILNSSNVTLEDIEIDSENPDEHELTVENITETEVDFRLDSESRYIKKRKHFYFVGKDYETNFLFNAETGWYFGKISGKDRERIVRSRHPLFGAKEITEVEPGLFRARYDSTEHFEKGETYCLYDLRRTHVGIFAEKSDNITFRALRQRHNVSLALVCQNCNNITAEKCEFCPAENQVKQFVSYADFMQICMCRGLLKVTDCIFTGAGDDVLNVHGTHLKIVSVRNNTLRLRFMHPESYGYLPFNQGDIIEFVNPSTLLPEGETRVNGAKLISEKIIELSVSSSEKAKKGLFVENVTLCPDVLFAGNYMSRVVTRGLLITTRGKVIIENNDFANLIMPAVLCSDDARSWFESGCCKDVTVRNNHFGKNDGPYISVLPENTPNRNAVHGDFLVEGNVFDFDNGVDFQRCNSVIFRNNRIKGTVSDFVKCTDVLHCTAE